MRRRITSTWASVIDNRDSRPQLLLSSVERLDRKASCVPVKRPAGYRSIQLQSTERVPHCLQFRSLL